MVWCRACRMHPVRSSGDDRCAHAKTERAVAPAHLNVPLIAVELAYGPDFELEDPDADILIRRRGRDVMGQKERLKEESTTKARSPRRGTFSEAAMTHFRNLRSGASRIQVQDAVLTDSSCSSCLRGEEYFRIGANG